MNSTLRPHQVSALAMLRQSLVGEEWREVVGYQRYFVSNHGRVYSTIRRGRVLRQTLTPQGYPYVSLMRPDGRASKVCVHRLVAEAFLGKPGEGMVVNHRSGDKSDNRVENLEWCTYGQNNEHARRTGLSSALGETHYAARLSDDDVREIRRRVALGEMHRLVAGDYGVARQTVTKIANGQARRAVA